MPINSYVMGPGTLVLGAGGAQAASAQVTSCQIDFSESVTTREAIRVLTGEEIPKEEVPDYAATMGGEFLQDLAIAGIVAWSWTNKGQWMDFTFVPNTAGARKVTGKVCPVPLTVGGAVETGGNRPRASFTWRVQGMPVLAATP